jgi:branched-chain amino acid transport system substrate-binding protein
MDLPNQANKEFVDSFKSAYGREPSEYAAYGYDTAMLLDGAIRQAGGDLSNKDALRAALRDAKFNSVRGTFRFNRNHFPIQDWYVRAVVDDGDSTKSQTLEKIFTAAEDRFADQCSMK